MKVGTRISVEPYRCKGRIKAEGKKAKPSFCFRAKSQGSGGSKTTVLELHSRVTGKQIGWFGGRGKSGFAKTREEAQTWDYLNGSFAADEFGWFLRDAGQKFVTDWNRPAKEAVKAMVKASKKP